MLCRVRRCRRRTVADVGDRRREETHGLGGGAGGQLGGGPSAQPIGFTGQRGHGSVLKLDTRALS